MFKNGPRQVQLDMPVFVRGVSLTGPRSRNRAGRLMSPVGVIVSGSRDLDHPARRGWVRRPIDAEL
jgi:hypothetical protein